MKEENLRSKGKKRENQQLVDRHYDGLKKFLKVKIIEWAETLDTPVQQKKEIIKYADSISYSQAKRLRKYIETLSTINKQQKDTMEDILDRVKWLPDDVDQGILDGKVIHKEISPEFFKQIQILSVSKPQKGDKKQI